MKNVRLITAMTVTIAALSVPVWAQDTPAPTSPQTPTTGSGTQGGTTGGGSTTTSPSTSGSQSGQGSGSATGSSTGTTSSGSMSGGSMSGTSSNMTGDDYFNNMSSADKLRYSWVFNNLDQREVRRYRAQGFRDVDIRSAANIAMYTGLPLPYVLDRYRTTGLPLAAVAVQAGIPLNRLNADIPGYGLSSAEASMVMFGSGGSGMSGMSSGTSGSSTSGSTSTSGGSTGSGSTSGSTGSGTGTGSGSTGSGTGTGSGSTGSGTGTGTGSGTGSSSTGTGTGTGTPATP